MRTRNESAVTAATLAERKRGHARSSPRQIALLGYPAVSGIATSIGFPGLGFFQVGLDKGR
jgi:hypothetical protein